ncbi:MAG: antitoxin family protein [Dehalococcoidia bacterium]|nr:antitoxin family protein [Dehalococcoidia bacterium]
MAKATTIRARYSKGVIEPLEEIDIAEGKEVTITIVEAPPEYEGNDFEKSAGGWRGTVDAEKLIRDIYADRLVSTRWKPKL